MPVNFDVLTRRMAKAIDPIPSDDPIAGQYRARQIGTLVRFTPLIGIGNLLNGLLLWAAMRGEAGADWLDLWLVALCGIVLYGMRPWWRSRRRPPPASVSRRALWSATRGAALLGVLWSVPVWGLFPGADPDGRLLLTAVATGMVCTGGFVLASVPAAAFAYVGTLGAATLFALSGSALSLGGELSLLFVSYAMVALGGIVYVGRSFLMQLLGELRAARQREDIGLLLRDFEASTSDILWETDRDGRLIKPSPRMLETLRMGVDDAVAEPLTSILALFDRCADRRNECPVAELVQRFERGAPFRELVLKVDFGAGRRWMSLTAKPARAPDGSVWGWRGVMADITATREAHHQLFELAHRDSLTGLANRHEFVQRLSTTLRSVGPRCALIIVDLDGFKAVNDALGHQAGDALLVTAAARLRDAVADAGLVARLGGDEFAILLADAAADARAVTALAARLIDVMDSPCTIGTSRVKIGASLGASMAPDHGVEVEALMTAADLALYQAKHEGRGQWRVFDRALGESKRRRIDIERGLRHALERNEFSLVFQPQVRPDGLRIAGFEALLRWRSPTLGNVGPDEFIPIAEESGLIVEIGRWVLSRACVEAMRWPDHLRVGVNVSPSQVIGASLAQGVEAALSQSGLHPGRLELEITESLLLENSAETVDRLHALKRRGVKFALDDFGRGYSSLVYLRRFPFDTLKIDREFVRGIESAPENRAIVRTVLGLARALGMETVAEGVESEGELAVLRNFGCELVQGYLISRPLSADDANAYARARRVDRSSEDVLTAEAAVS